MEKTKEVKLQELGKDGMGKSNVKTKGFRHKRKKGQGGLLNVYGTVNTTLSK